ncbi:MULTISPECIES: acetyl-CoA carboxylase [Acidiphilium]|uniref:acetyl-CoA carboxylase n=1 Tax=Acidiphilium TaxID=522 RepID=UPI0002144AB5|nr:MULTISPECIES: acetyl-CoA carboxylase [Acidiphilium]EGO93682.1 Biotin/lipoyl attachment protein [Acidiphilium sp. PM]UNC16608.1 biotin carboxyl carrier domain-containing protein [Acidiphilium multivorum]
MSKIEIKSPLPGTFYRRPAPDQPEFKQDGDNVGPADTIGLVEVMKTFHQVPAGVTGRAIAFRVGDAEAIMAGQVIAEVEE